MPLGRPDRLRHGLLPDRHHLLCGERRAVLLLRRRRRNDVRQRSGQDQLPELQSAGYLLSGTAPRMLRCRLRLLLGIGIQTTRSRGAKAWRRVAVSGSSANLLGRELRITPTPSRTRHRQRAQRRSRRAAASRTRRGGHGAPGSRCRSRPSSPRSRPLGSDLPSAREPGT